MDTNISEEALKFFLEKLTALSKETGVWLLGDDEGLNAHTLNMVPRPGYFARFEHIVIIEATEDFDGYVLKEGEDWND